MRSFSPTTDLMKVISPLRMARRTLLRLLLVAPLAACGGGDAPVTVPAAILEQRTMAFRQACAAKEIEATAEDNLSLLESIIPEGDDAGMAATRDAATGFARGYHRHAELRFALFAMVDSAFNHARTPADSTRFEERANAFSLRNPAAGTVEANAMESYENDLRMILSDADHPCNWNIPSLGGPS